MPELQDSTPRVTQKDIAKVAGVSRATVTYALKDHPRLSAATRERIKGIAIKLGYVPDPLFATLAQYRSRRRTASYHGTLAWLVREPSGPDAHWWHESPHYLGYFEGAQRHAPSHGYRVEEFRFNSTTAPLRRMHGILSARGIQGILLCPLPEFGVDLNAFPWQKFSAVTFGYTLRVPRLHTVASAHFQNVRHAMQKLRERGYRRPGFVIPRVIDLRCDCAFSGGYLASQVPEDGAASELIPALFPHHDPFDKKTEKAYVQEVATYVQEQRIDALLTVDSGFLDTLNATRTVLPGKPVIALISQPHADPRMAGIVEDSAHMGAVAVDLLTSMIQRGKRGVPPMPVRTHVEGVWNEGRSLPARNQPKAAKLKL